MLAVRPVPAERATPVIGRLRRAISGCRPAGAGEHTIVAFRRLGMELGESAACDLIVGGRIGIPATAAASYRADRLDRDTAQDIVQHRRIAIDGPAIAAIARSFAKLPAPVRQDRKSTRLNSSH